MRLIDYLVYHRVSCKLVVNDGTDILNQETIFNGFVTDFDDLPTSDYEALERRALNLNIINIGCGVGLNGVPYVSVIVSGGRADDPFGTH